MTAAPNGATAIAALSTADERTVIERLAAEIEDELVNAELELADAQAVYEQHRDVVARLRRAHADLVGTPKPAKPAPAGNRTGTKTGNGTYAPVSPANLGKTLRLLGSVEQPVTVDRLYEHVKSTGGGISRDTIRRALMQGRDEDRVRVAGRTQRGGMLYALMPSEGDE